MTERVVHKIKGFWQRYGRRLIDFFYWATTSPILVFGAAVLVMLLIAVAVANDLIQVPFYHAD